MLWRRHKNRTDTTAGRPARDPFEAVPHVAPGVEARADPEGHIHLSRRIIPRLRVLHAVERRFGWRRTVQVNLDANGSLFWNQIDGTQSLEAIAKCIQKETGQSEEACRKATALFTRDLMARGLIQLEVPLPSEKGGAT